MPAFLFLLALTVLGALTSVLCAAVRPSAVVLPFVLTLGVAALAHAFRPTPVERPRATSPDAPEGWLLSEDLRTLNADLWLMEGLRACEGSQFYTLGSTPIWVRPCAVKSCEHLSPLGCFCVEDCDCAYHTDARDGADAGFAEAL